MLTIKQEIDNYNIPLYVEDILSHNYCPNFLNMTMVKENDEYIFNYKTGRYRRLDITKLDTYLKLVLLRSIILLNERNENWLIKAENYLIEPELIYSLNNNVEEGCVRILFYPDYKHISFSDKMKKFADKLKNRKDKNEIELIEKFKNSLVENDWNKTKIFLDKNILRLETTWN